MKKFFTLSMLGIALAASAAGPMRTPEAPGPIISEAPAGISQIYDMIYSGFFVNYADIDFVEDQKIQTEVVLGDDGGYYFRDLFPFMPYHTFVRGEMDETGAIIVPLPQTIAYEETSGDGENWLDLNIFYSPDLDTTPPEPVTDENINRISFTIQEDGSLLMTPLEEGYSLSAAYTQDWGAMWMAFSVTAMTLVESEGISTNIPVPEDLETKEYSYITYGYAHAAPEEKDFGYHIQIGLTEDEVYIGGLSIDLRHAWIKGRREGNRLIFPNNQPLGVVGGVYSARMMYGKVDPRAIGGYSLLPEETEFVMEIDEEKGIVTTISDDVVVFFNTQTTEIKYLQKFEDLEFYYQPEAKGAPMDPWNLKFIPRNSGINYDYIDFNLPIVTADGTLLYRENMYYRLFIDGEQLEILDIDFDSGVDMWDIPYDFDRYLIVCTRLSTDHEMGIRMEGYDSFGIQSVNIWDGVEYESAIVTYEINPQNGIFEPVASGHPAIVSTEYLDLQGRRIPAPQPGMIGIMRQIDEEGNVSYSKIIQ